MADLVVKNVTEHRDLITRNIANRNDDVDVGAGSYPYIIASAVAEALTLMSANAQSIARTIPLSEQSETDLEAKYGTTVPRLQETYSSGSIIVECTSAGTTIQVGDTLVDADTKQSFITTIATATTYANLEWCPVRSVDPGPETNVAAGKTLTWSTIRSGCYASAEVAEAPDGSGLSGGRGIESVEEWRARISDHLANPAGHGNEQDVITLVEDATGRTLSTGESTTGHGMPVQKGFAYPTIMGPGTCGFAFLIKQDDWWKSRTPSSTQITTVFAYVKAALPKDSVLPVTVQDEALSIDMTVTLDPRATQWADFSPWPSSATRGAGRKVVSASPGPSATTFRIVTDDADYTGETSPSAGQSIGFFDSTTGTFRKKKIAIVSGSGPWDIAVAYDDPDTDLTYVPIAGCAVCPWTAALPAIAEAIGSHVAKCGVGQCVADDPGDGTRMMRIPLDSLNSWPTTITQRVAYDVVDTVSAVSGASFVSALPSSLTVEGVDLVNTFLLTDLGIYKAP